MVSIYCMDTMVRDSCYVEFITGNLRGSIPALSRTVRDQFEIVYTARIIAPTGSIHQKNLSPRTAATRPTIFVITSK